MVERAHGTSQDRLIKKLRRKGVTDYRAANAYLEAEYFDGHNARFAHPPSAPEDFHTAVPRGVDLAEVFRLETARILSNDWVVRHDNRWFQVHRQSRYAPARSTVLVCEYEDGRIAIEYRGRTLAQTELPAPPLAPRVAPRVATSRRSSTPPATHPWRRSYQELPDRGPWKPGRSAGCGNGGGVDAPDARAHPALEISRLARDFHIPISPLSST